MDQSFASVGNKFPPGEPDEDWTIEELLRWSLDRHHSSAIEKTAASITSLKDRCERECEDVMLLHKMAVEIEDDRRRGGDGQIVDDAKANCNKDEENQDPQRMSLDSPPTTSAAQGQDVVVIDGSASSSALPTASTISTLLTIQIFVGPHAPSTYHLHPKPGTPCLIGRSKGKKFLKNGISLHKDQEVSTTHGKFVVVEEEGGGNPRYYFVDVGSTNGTVHNGMPLEPNIRLELRDGVELKVGNSFLRIMLG